MTPDPAPVTDEQIAELEARVDQRSDDASKGWAGSVQGHDRELAKAVPALISKVKEQAAEIVKLREGWLDQAARDVSEIVRLEVEVDRLRVIMRGFLDCPEIADCAPDDKDPETDALEREARSALPEERPGLHNIDPTGEMR